MGSAQYGAFVGVASFLSVLGQFSTVGMDLILVRDVSRDRSRFGSSWGLSLEIAFIGFLAISAIALLAGRLFLHGETYWLIPGILVADCLLAKIALLASKAFQSVGSFTYSAQVMALTNFTRVLTAGGLYLWVLRSHRHATAQMWTSIYWVSSLAAAIIGFWLVTVRIGLPRWARVDFHAIVEGLGFSVSSSSISIYNDIDKTILVALGQNQAAGIYSAAYRIIDVASTPIYSVYTAAFPSFFQEGAKSTRDALKLAIKLSRRTIPYSLAAAAFMGLGAGFLPLVLGRSFGSSVSALRWLCLLPLIRCFHYAAGMTITASVSQWYRTAQQVAVAFLNFGLNMILIPRYSWQGAAAASLLSDGALALMNWAFVIYLIQRQKRRLQCLS
jgi:O-antigen/teichoic acid export membrane protein